MTSDSSSLVAQGRSGTDRRFAAHPETIWLLLGGTLLVRAAGFAYPFMAYHVSAGGHHQTAVGAVLAFFGVGWAVGQLACGWLIDRIGRKFTLVATMAAATVAMGTVAGADGLASLMVAAAVAGVVYDAPRPVLSAAIGDLVADPKARAKVDGWQFGLVLNLGAAVAGGAGGLLAESLGTAVLYWINGIACGVFAVVALWRLPGNGAGRVSATLSNYRQAFTDTRLALLFTSGLATLTTFNLAFLVTMPLLMADHGLGPGIYGFAVMANGLAVVALTPLLTPWLSGKLAVRPRLDMLAGAGAWVAVSMAALTIAEHPAGFVIAAITCAPGELTWLVVGASLVHWIAPPTHRGRYHGVWGTTFALAAIIAPLLGAWSLTYGGPCVVTVMTLATGLCGVALCWPLARSMAQSAHSD